MSCPVSEILSLISQDLKSLRDPEDMPFGAIYHVCITAARCESAQEIMK